VLDWFAKQTGLTVTLHRSVSADDGRLFRWSARTATTEAWLDGLAQALKVAAFVAPDGTVTLYQTPTIIPLDNDPDLITKDPRLVYQPPPPARLDTEISLDFQELELGEVAKVLQNALQYPVEIDPQVLTAGPPPVILRVEEMKIRYVVDFVAKLTDLKAEILPDRVRLTQTVSESIPRPDDAPVVPAAAQ
jgi:type II secretory pathway component GspD/PulD (secretin)